MNASFLQIDAPNQDESSSTKKVKKQQPFQKSQVVLAPPPLPTKNSWTKVSWKPKRSAQNELFLR